MESNSAPLFARDGPGADYEELVVVQDPPSGLRAIVALHSTALGPAFGGIRRRAYASEAEAVDDVLKLASAMTLKCALAELPAGGGKSVILDHAGLDAPAAYRALGRAVERLGGRYVCGPDVGTGERELDCVREGTRHVNPRGNDASASTALGVIAGIRGTLDVLEGDADVAGRRFVVQGLGGVGFAAARFLVQAGAEVAGFDVSAGARERAAAADVRIVEDPLREPCDVFVPCALGGVVTPKLAESAPWRAVCGSANNALASPEAGVALHRRGIPYAPDFIVNAGAVIEGVLTTRDGATDAARARAREHIERIRDTTRRVLEAARAADEPPERVAVAEARARVDAARPK